MKHKWGSGYFSLLITANNLLITGGNHGVSNGDRKQGIDLGSLNRWIDVWIDGSLGRCPWITGCSNAFCGSPKCFLGSTLTGFILLFSGVCVSQRLPCTSAAPEKKMGGKNSRRDDQGAGSRRWMRRGVATSVHNTGWRKLCVCVHVINGKREVF